MTEGEEAGEVGTGDEATGGGGWNIGRRIVGTTWTWRRCETRVAEMKDRVSVLMTLIYGSWHGFDGLFSDSFCWKGGRVEGNTCPSLMSSSSGMREDD